jgi:hypothetical protein
MADNVQAEANHLKKNLSHISLIKLLIVEQLRKLGKSWDFFLLAVDIPRDPKGDSSLPMGKETSYRAEAEIGRAIEKEKTLEAFSPQQSIPRKRGRPRKNRETEKAQAPNEPRAKSFAEELLMRVIQVEPVKGPKREICTRRRSSDVEDMDTHELSQQLKQA